LEDVDFLPRHFALPVELMRQRLSHPRPSKRLGPHANGRGPQVQYRREHDPAQPGKTVMVPVDLSGLISSGVLTVCDPQNQQELNQFTRYAAIFRSDGEAMCLALALERKWVVATDDRKAIRVAQKAGLTIVSCPELVKTWADSTRPNQTTLNNVVQDIQVLAQFKPNPTMPEYQWWVDELARSGP
jgi:hypothetical protein